MVTQQETLVNENKKGQLLENTNSGKRTGSETEANE